MVLLVLQGYLGLQLPDLLLLQIQLRFKLLQLFLSLFQRLFLGFKIAVAVSEFLLLDPELNLGDLEELVYARSLFRVQLEHNLDEFLQVLRVPEGESLELSRLDLDSETQVTRCLEGWFQGSHLVDQAPSRPDI